MFEGELGYGDGGGDVCEAAYSGGSGVQGAEDVSEVFSICG